MTESIIQTRTTFLITLITMTTSLLFYQTIFHYMYMYIGLNFKLYRKGQQIETAFHIYIKVGFQNLFFRLSDTHTISTSAPMQSTKITLLSIFKNHTVVFQYKTVMHV